MSRATSAGRRSNYPLIEIQIKNHGHPTLQTLLAKYVGNVPAKVLVQCFSECGLLLNHELQAGSYCVVCSSHSVSPGVRFALPGYHNVRLVFRKMYFINK